MSELERLRDAMRVTERPDAVLDLVTVMREGRRLRTRRRVAGAGAATLATGFAAMVVVVAAGASGPGDPAPTERPQPVAVAPPSVGVSPWAEKSPPGSTPPPTMGRDVPQPKPMGQIVDTKVRHGQDRRVYYFVAVSVPGEPKVSIGLAAGRQAPDGSLTTDILVNDVYGSDRSAGFHQIGYDDGAAAPVPTFGYFVGPAKRIIGTVDDRQVDARVAPWSADKQVLIFWFDPAQLSPGERLDGIVAHDANGRRL
ncbi:hypothetical protein AB0877_30165 [Micromonospora sp. NPDC047644]|uniref:hypothetical protein n=1 Tax=Micromonospora sp. NPDC047644 TaxID=3157203 RepID=UPI00345512C7